MDTIKGENKTKECLKDQPADFETAMEASGFGLFNFLLLLVAIPSCVATSFETSTMSFILPSAECDLRLTLLDKGILNAITYAGMITSAIGWGYIADTKGRKNILVFGYLLDAVCVFGSSISQNVTTLMIFKFFGGLVVNGPFAVLMSYMTEFHGYKHRARVMMVFGMLFSTATLLLPGIAWIILPNSWDYQLIQDVIVIHSWQVFLAICALPSLVSGFVIMMLPESPKFLMAQGRNKEALNVFKKIYAINHRKPRNSYPIYTLVEEVPQRAYHVHDNIKICTIESLRNTSTKVVNKPINRSALDALREGLKQIRPMFSKPYLGYSLHVYTLQFCILLGLNTIRLWLPQMFASIAEFDQINQNSTDTTNLCAIFEYSVNKTKITTGQIPDICEVTLSDEMYLNTIIVGITGLVGYFVAGGLINALGEKWMLIIGLTTSGVCGLSLYWATNALTTLILSSLYVTVGSIGTTSLVGVVVNLFPTSLRTMIISILMMFGRLGALIGNILFPYFMTLGCVPPFLMVGCIMLVASSLSSILPNTSKAALR